MQALRRQADLFGSRRKTEAGEKSIHSKRCPSPACAAESNTSISSTSASTNSSDHTSTTSSSPTPSPPTMTTLPPEQPAFTPPPSTSPYQWHHLPSPRSLWWRTVDSMANFILHWQERFHQHGDMFASCTLTIPSSSEPCSLTRSQLREALRRLRFDHPTIALRLAKRRLEGIPKRDDIPALLARKVDLQVALVYDCLSTEADVERWLDDILVYHDEERLPDEEEFQTFLTRATAEGVPGRDRLRVHYWPPTPHTDGRLLVEQCHSVSEGVGTLIAFDLLISYIASVLTDPQPRVCAWGEEVVRLEPSLQDAIADPPESWTVSKTEKKRLQQINAGRMNGKATPPNIIDRLGGEVVTLALNSHAKSTLRRTLTKPLLRICRTVAEKGHMLPLGLLPQTGLPFTGNITHTATINDTLPATQTTALLTLLKKRGLTLAPFLEACAHMSTTWVRRHRLLTPTRGYDDPTRILGSFSNAISKRDTLLPQYRRYLGLCMSGFPTKISAGSAAWSASSEEHTTASPTDPRDPLPRITRDEVDQVMSLSTVLATQYHEGRNTPHWLLQDQTLLHHTMISEYLLLRDEAHYPSMPWLSSVGRIESFFRPSHPLEDGKTLEVGSMKLVGRVGIRQPILHVWSFRGETTVQVSFAEWLYREQRPASERQQRGEGEGKERQNILKFWLQVFRSLIDAVLLESDSQSPAMQGGMQE